MLEMNQVNITEEKVYYRWSDRNRTITPVAEESCTDTSFGNDTDINNIVARFKRTGKLPEGPQTRPIYADVTALQGDLAEMITRSAELRAELEEAQHQHQEQKAQQAVEDAEELARYRAQEAAGAEAPTDGTPPTS